MIKFLNERRCRRELFRLAKRHDFGSVKADYVASVLERMANQLAANQVSLIDLSSQVRIQKALMDVWELARAQADKNPFQKTVWTRIMLACNSLYGRIETQLSAQTENRAVSNA